MNRRIHVLIWRRDDQSEDGWEIEQSFVYNPSTLTIPHAQDIRPRIAFTISALIGTADFIDAWIKRHMKDIAEKIEEVTT